MVLITIVTGAFVNQLITGGPHIVCIHRSFKAALTIFRFEEVGTASASSPALIMARCITSGTLVPSSTGTTGDGEINGAERKGCWVDSVLWSLRIHCCYDFSVCNYLKIAVLIRKIWLLLYISQLCYYCENGAPIGLLFFAKKHH